MSEPTPNLDQLKNELKAYYESGQYDTDIASTLEPAYAHLDKYIGTTKPCIVLDIDETAISEYPLMKKHDFGFDSAFLDECDYYTNLPYIIGTLNLFIWTIGNYIDVFFVTGRREKYRAETATLLKNCNYTLYKDLYMKPNDDQESDAMYKENTRKKIIALGYTIALMVDDQSSALNGNYYDLGIKLPNPFYDISLETSSSRRILCER